MLSNDLLGGVTGLFDNPMREIVALASGVLYGGGCVVEWVTGLAQTSFEDRFCERRGRIEKERGPEP
jgi:hypothetical protein